MMSTYDFATLINRSHQGSAKWEQMHRDCPDVGDNIVPFSVADMEFRHPPELINGLKQYTDSMIFGYTGPTDAYFESVENWMQLHHGFRPPREWFVEYPGVVPALRDIVAKLTAPDDSVLIFTPVYYPFRSSVRDNGRNLVESQLIERETTYDINFADVEQKLARPDVTMMILCSPHNPVGRVWTEDELLRLSALCKEHHVLLVSDEIHSDLILPGYHHVSVATLTEYLDNCIICTAPSKTFNLAGLQTSNIFIPNESLRHRLLKHRGFFTLNAYGYKACEIAYNECGEWLEQLLHVIVRNYELVRNVLHTHLPQVKVFDLQGTYLQWLDFRSLGMSPKRLQEFMRSIGWFCDEGYIFGDGGHGFERLNLACPTWVLEQALGRLIEATHPQEGSL